MPRKFPQPLDLLQLTILGASCWIGATLSGIANPEISSVGHTPGGKISFELGPDPGGYHILRRSHDLSEVGNGRPVAIVRSNSSRVTIADSSRPKSRAFYQLSHFRSSQTGDIDNDGFSDWLEMARPGYYNPLNPAPPVNRIHGSLMLTDRAHYERMAGRDGRPGAPEIREVKFLVYNVHTPTPVLYFADTTRYQYHYDFTNQAVNRYSSVSLFQSHTYFNNSNRRNLAGSLIAHDNYVDDKGQRGLYTVEFWPTDPVAFRFVEKGYELIAASMPFVDGNIAYHPASETQRTIYEDEK